MNDDVLRLAELSARYGRRAVFENVDLTLAAGETVALIGPSGVGKTTLLTIVLGLLSPATGSVSVAGESLTGARAAQRTAIRRRHVGVVFQHGELLPQLTPKENVAMPMLLDGTAPGAAFDRAADLLRRLGVADVAMASNRLSGGERQRTALARALATAPRLIVGDEPTGSLDGATRDAVADELFAHAADSGAGLLVVTHDPAIAARADRTALLTPAGLEWKG